LDEPELGLHPYAISLLAGMLQSAATRTQVIVATQSVTLVNQFTPEDIIVVDRENKQSVFRHPDKKIIENWMRGKEGTGENAKNATKIRINSKHEIRNSKQIQITKI
jgi:predicted ATPase